MYKINGSIIEEGDIISMDNRRQYTYTNTASTAGAWKGYDIQAVSLNPGDVLLVHISSYMDLDDCRNIMKMLEETFPNNKCVLCNEHILKGMTVIRAAETKKVDDVVNISTNVDIDALFNEIMRGNPNDFLY
jgi:hypothetical protein